MKIKTIISTILLCFAFVGNAFANRYDKELLEACESNDQRNVIYYLEKGANPNITKIEGNDNWPLLAIACRGGQFPIVENLVKKGASVNYLDTQISPLAIASKKHNEKIIEYLLERGADPNGIDDTGNTAFMNMIKTGLDAICLKLIAEEKIELSIQNKKTGHNALSYIILTGNDALLNTIVAANMYSGNVNSNLYITSESCNLLEYTMKVQNLQAMKVLLKENRDNVTKLDVNGVPPLLWAIREHISIKMIKSLLTLEPFCVTATDDNDEDAYDYLDKYYNNDEIREACDEAHAKLQKVKDRRKKRS